MQGREWNAFGRSHPSQKRRVGTSLWDRNVGHPRKRGICWVRGGPTFQWRDVGSVLSSVGSAPFGDSESTIQRTILIHRNPMIRTLDWEYRSYFATFGYNVSHL